MVMTQIHRWQETSSAAFCSALRCACGHYCMPVTLRGAEKQRTKPWQGLGCLYMHIPQLNMSRGKTHYKMLLSLWGWVKLVTGVCFSVPCSFQECPQSTRSSRTASKLESKYYLSWTAILRGHAEEQIPLSHFQSLYPLNASVICGSDLTGKKITCCASSESWSNS